MTIQLVKYGVVLTFLEQALGTVPMNQDIYRDYIESKKPEDQQDEEYKSVEAREERGYTGFHREADEITNQGGVGRILKKGRMFTYDYTIRGFMKESGNALRQIHAHDIKATKSKIDQFVFVDPRRIFFLDSTPHQHGSTIDGGCGHDATPTALLQATGTHVDARQYETAGCYYVHEAHGVLERPLRADTAQGPRVALTRSDYLRPGVKLAFTLKNLWPEVFTEDVLHLIFERGELIGYGQWRSGSYGRFSFTLERDPNTPNPTRKKAEDNKPTPAPKPAKRGKAATPAAVATDDDAADRGKVQQAHPASAE